MVKRTERIIVPCIGVDFWQKILRLLDLPDEQGRCSSLFLLPFLSLVNLFCHLHIVVSHLTAPILVLSDCSFDSPSLINRIKIVEVGFRFRSQYVQIFCLLFGQQCAVVHQGFEFELTLHFLRLRSLRLRQAFLHLMHVLVDLFDFIEAGLRRAQS